MKLYNNQKVFFELLRAGLWGDQGSVQEFKSSRVQDSVDWGRVYQIAQEQSVQGLVLSGLEELRAKDIELSVPKILLLQLIGEVQMIEQRNKDMNAFVAELIVKLRKNDVYAILVKGQGIAQCYERPLWRTCGDVDLLLSDTNYEKAKAYLVPLAERTETEFKIFKHYGMTIKGWEVELHGTLRPRLSNRIDRGVDEVQNDVFYGGNVRSVTFNANHNDNANFRISVQVFMPAPDDDIIFQITHILKHFYQGGIGLRQLCDLSRFLWTYRDKLNPGLLESRLKKMGIMEEWRAFAAFIHEYLGTPAEVIPLYNENDNHNANLKKKAERICDFVMEVGNFGHNRTAHDEGLKVNGFVSRKAVSLWWRTKDSFRHFCIFPMNSVKVWCHMMWTGLTIVVRGK